MPTSLTALLTGGLCFAALLFCHAPVHSTLAAESPLATFRHRFWTRDQGLPSDEVRALLQTRDGYLWIGTRAGLARFDGIRFTVFNRSNTPEMISDTITALAEDTFGNLWVGTTEGLLSWNGRSFRRHDYAADRDLAGIGEKKVNVLQAGTDGMLWVGSYCGLFLWNSDRWSHWGGKEGIDNRFVTALCEDPGNGVWFSTPTSLAHIDQASGKLSRLPDPPSPAKPSALGLVRAQDGSLSAVLSEGPNGLNIVGLYRLEGGQWFRYPGPEICNHGRPPFLCRDARGGLWLAASRQALYRFHDSAFTTVAIPAAMLNDYILSGLEDREGNLWLGTETGGLHQLQPKKIFSLSARDGLAHDNVRTILETRDGSVWIGTDGGLTRLLAGQVTNYTEKVGLARNDVRALAEDHEGCLWIGTGSGLDCLDKGRLIHHRFPGEWFETKIRALHTGGDGALWVGALKGLHCLHQGQHTAWTGTNGLVHDDARAVFQDRAGTVWIGTDGAGLLRLRAGQLDRFTTTNGMASDHVFGFCEDAEGVLWFGSERGLHRLQAGRFTVFARREGLFDGPVNRVLEDDFGHLWLSGNHGIARVRKTELNDVAAGRAKTVSCAVYDEADGMLSSETTGQLSQPAGCKTRDGRLWFPTIKGVVIIDPRTLQAAELPPPVVIEQLRADNEIVYGDGANPSLTRPAGTLSRPTRRAVAPSQRAGEGRGEGHQSSILNAQSPIRLPPGHGRVLEFHYTANTFIAPEKARFKYRLDGYDKDWHDAGPRRVAYYTNLRPGDYRFRVLAANHHNVWNETGATLGFYLAPFFYQTWTFRIGCVLAAALAIFAIFRWRLAELRKIQRLEKKAALVEERARLAKDLHDGLGANLTQLTLLADLAGDDAPATERARQISKTARTVLHSLKDFIWATHPAEASLESLMAQVCQQAEDLSGHTGLRVRFDVPQNLPEHPVPAAVRQDILFTAKEALNNIARHASASEVRITVAVSDATFTLSIQDNGCGFAVPIPQSEIRNPHSRGGHGLPNMRERIKSIQGRFYIHSHPGKGTKIAIEIPRRLLRDE